MTLHHNDDSNQRSNDDDDDGPVTVIVTRKAKKGKIREFGEWMENKIVERTIIALSISCVLVFSFLVNAVSATTAHENSSKTIKHKDLTIDLGNGIQTDAELTMPVLANRSLPAILLIHGIGPLDKDQFIPPDSRDFKQIAEYLSERGFGLAL